MYGKLYGQEEMMFTKENQHLKSQSFLEMLLVLNLKGNLLEAHTRACQKNFFSS